MKNKQCMLLWGEFSAWKFFQNLAKIYVELLLCKLRCYFRKKIVHYIDWRRHLINVFLENILSEIDRKTHQIYKIWKILLIVS